MRNRSWIFSFVETVGLHVHGRSWWKRLKNLRKQVRNQRKARKHRYEPLEARTLLAADIDFTNNVLTVTGTVNADDFEIQSIASEIVLIEADTSGGGSNTIYTGIATTDVNEIKMYGLDGNDRLAIDSSVGAITARIEGGNGDDELVGGIGRDLLFGDAGVDQLNGSAGDDDVHFDEFDTVILGGDGSDVARAWGAQAGIQFDMAANSFETIYGSHHDDIITAAGLPVAAYIYGYGGADTLTGSDHADRIYGNDGNDTIYGGAGNDTLYGYGDVDAMYGQDGDDYIHFDNTDTAIDGGAGYDTANPSGATAAINLNLVDWNLEFVLGTAYDDTISGAGAPAGIKIYGYGGNDTLTGSDHADLIIGHDGDDTIYGGGGNDELQGFAGDDALYGQDGNDRLHPEGNDLLDGGAGHDTLHARNTTHAINIDLVTASFESFRGSEYDDVVLVHGATTNTDILAYGGNDQVTIHPGANGIVVSVDGGDPSGPDQDSVLVVPPSGQQTTHTETGVESGHFDTTGGFGQVTYSNVGSASIQPGIADPIDLVLFDGVPITVPANIGDIGAADVDVYGFHLVENQQLTVDLDALSTEFGAPISGLQGLIRLFDESGVEVANSGTTSFADDPTLSFTATTAGKYYLGVSSFENQSYGALAGSRPNNVTQGDYQLHLVTQKATQEVVYDNTYTVNTGAEDTTPNNSVLSLREAVALANASGGNDRIVFAVSEIQLLDGPIVVNGKLRFEVDGYRELTVIKPNVTATDKQLLRIGPSAEVDVSRIVFEGDDSIVEANDPMEGGAIFAEGKLVLTESEIRGASAQQRGGGLFLKDAADVRVVNSSIRDSVAESGGAIYVSPGATLVVVSSTISGNFASLTGDAISSEGTVSLSRTSVVRNGAASTGATIDNTGSEVIYVRNTLVSNNDSADDIGGTFVSHGFNLIGDVGNATGIGVVGHMQDQYGGAAGPVLDGKAGEIHVQGGLFATSMLLNGSPAIDAGSSFGAPETDQRGARRVLDGPEPDVTDTQRQADIGATEFGTFFVNSSVDAIDSSAAADGIADASPATDLQITLRAAVQEFSSLAGWEDAETITRNELDAYIVLEPELNQLNLNIQGRGEDFSVTGDLDIFGHIIIEGRNQDYYDEETRIVAAWGADSEIWRYDRLFHVLPDSRLDIDSMQLYGGVTYGDGQEDFGHGGGILNDGGELNLNNVRLGHWEAPCINEDHYFCHTFNYADEKGGAIYSRLGTTLVYNSFIGGADSAHGGGIYVESGDVTIDGQSSIDLNRARSHGGAAFVESGELLVTGQSELINNVIVGPGTAAGIHIAPEALVTINDSSKLDDSVADSHNVGIPPGDIKIDGLGIYNEGRFVTESGALIQETGIGIRPDPYNYLLQGIAIYNTSVAELNDTTVKKHLGDIHRASIYNAPQANLVLRDTLLTENHTALINDKGYVTVDRSRIELNTLGGIRNIGIGSELDVSNSVINENGLESSIENHFGTVNVSGTSFVRNWNSVSENHNNHNIGHPSIRHIGLNPLIHEDASTLAVLTAGMDEFQTVIYVNDVSPLQEFELPLEVAVEEEILTITSIDSFRRALHIERTDPVPHDVSAAVAPFVNETQRYIKVGDITEFLRYELPFDIIIDAEVMTVTDIEDELLTVVRGRSGTVPARHPLPYRVFALSGPLTVTNSSFTGNFNGVTIPYDYGESVYSIVDPFVRETVIESSSFVSDFQSPANPELPDVTHIRVGQFGDEIGELLSQEGSYTYEHFQGENRFPIDDFPPRATIYLENNVFAQGRDKTRIAEQEQEPRMTIDGLVQSGGFNFLEGAAVTSVGLQHVLETTDGALHVPGDEQVPPVPFLVRVGRIIGDEMGVESLLATDVIDVFGEDGALVEQVLTVQRGVGSSTPMKHPIGSRVFWSTNGFWHPDDQFGIPAGDMKRLFRIGTIAPTGLPANERLVTLDVADLSDIPVPPFEARLVSADEFGVKTLEDVEVTGKDGFTLEIERALDSPSHTSDLIMEFTKPLNVRLDAMLTGVNQAYVGVDDSAVGLAIPTPLPGSPLLDRGDATRFDARSTLIDSHLSTEYRLQKPVYFSIEESNHELTLNGHVFFDDEYVFVTDTSSLPEVPFVVQLGEEVLRVTNVDTSENRLDVERKQFGTDATYHSFGQVGKFGTEISSDITEDLFLVQDTTSFPPTPFFLTYGTEILQVEEVREDLSAIRVTRAAQNTIANAIPVLESLNAAYPNVGGVSLQFRPTGSIQLNEVEVVSKVVMAEDVGANEHILRVEAIPELGIDQIIGSVIENGDELIYVYGFSRASSTSSFNRLWVNRGYENTTAAPIPIETELDLKGKIYVTDAATLPFDSFYIRYKDDVIRVKEDTSETLTVPIEYENHKILRYDWEDNLAPTRIDLPKDGDTVLIGVDLVEDTPEIIDINVSRTEGLPATPFFMLLDHERFIVDAIDHETGNLTVRRGSMGTAKQDHQFGQLAARGEILAVEDTSVFENEVPFFARIGGEQVTVQGVDTANNLISITRATEVGVPLVHAPGNTIIWGTDAITAGYNVGEFLLVDAISASQTELAIASHAWLPNSFEMKIHDELMAVTSVTRNSDGTQLLQVERGIEGTAARAHAANANALPYLAVNEQQRFVQSSGGNTRSIDIGAHEAQVFVVDDPVDAPNQTPGDGRALTATDTTTLRAAIEEANALHGHATIVLPAGTYTLPSTLSVSSIIHIQGVNPQETTINAPAGLDAFSVSATGSLRLSKLNLEAGLLVEDGTLIVESSIITNAEGDRGGAIENQSGSVKITNSTIHGNTAYDLGGAIYSAGGSVELRGVTLSRNSATTSAGAIFADATASLAIQSSTIVYHESDAGGAGIVAEGTNASLKKIGNSLVAINTVATSTHADVDGYWTSEGGNLIGALPAPTRSLAETLPADQTWFIISDATNLPETPFPLLLDDEFMIVNDVDGNRLEVSRFSGGFHLPNAEIRLDGFFDDLDQVGSTATPLDPVITTDLILEPEALTPLHELLDGSPAVDGANTNLLDGPRVYLADWSAWSGTRITVTNPEVMPEVPFYLRVGTGQLTRLVPVIRQESSDLILNETINATRDAIITVHSDPRGGTYGEKLTRDSNDGGTLGGGSSGGNNTGGGSTGGGSDPGGGSSGLDGGTDPSGGTDPGGGGDPVFADPGNHQRDIGAFEFVTIVDVEGLTPVLSESVNGANTDNSKLRFKVTRSGRDFGDLAITYRVKGTGEFPVEHSDFEGDLLPVGTVEFLNGSTEEIVEIEIDNDVYVEHHEELTFELLPPISVHTLRSEAVAVIENDDYATIVANAPDEEEGRNVTVHFTLDGFIEGDILTGFVEDDLWLSWTTNDGTATLADNDYVGDSGYISFDGVHGERNTLVVEIVEDDNVELPETFTVDLQLESWTDVASYITLEPVEITISDEAPTPQQGFDFTEQRITAREGDPLPIEITYTGTQVPVVVDVEVVGVTAQEGVHYEPLTQQLVFTQPNETQTLEVQTLHSPHADARPPVFELQMTLPNGEELNAAEVAYGYIENTDSGWELACAPGTTMVQHNVGRTGIPPYLSGSLEGTGHIDILEQADGIVDTDGVYTLDRNSTIGNYSTETITQCIPEDDEDDDPDYEDGEDGNGLGAGDTVEADWVIPYTQSVTLPPFPELDFAKAEFFELVLTDNEDGSSYKNLLTLDHGTVRTNPDLTITYTPHSVPADLKPEVDPDGNVFRFTGFDNFQVHVALPGTAGTSAGDGEPLFASMPFQLAVSNHLPAKLGDGLHQLDANGNMSLDAAIFADAQPDFATEDEITFELDIRDLFTDPDGTADLASLRIHDIIANGEHLDETEDDPDDDPTNVKVKVGKHMSNDRHLILSRVDDYRFQVHNETREYDIGTGPEHWESYAPLVDFQIVVTDGQYLNGKLHKWEVRAQARVNNNERHNSDWREGLGVPNSETRPWVRMVSPGVQSPDYVPDTVYKLTTVTSADIHGHNIQDVGGASVDLFDGSLTEFHPMILDASGGSAEMALSGLIYESASIPELSAPTIYATLGGTGIQSGVSVTAELDWYSSLEDPPVTKSFSAGTTSATGLLITASPDQVPTQPGLYHWELRVTAGDQTVTTRGELPVWPTSSTNAPFKNPFGDGWSLAGVPQFLLDSRGTTKIQDDRILMRFPGEEIKLFDTLEVDGELRSLRPGTSLFAGDGFEVDGEFGKLTKEGDNLVYTATDGTKFTAVPSTVGGEQFYLVNEIEPHGFDNANAGTDKRRGISLVWDTAGGSPKLTSATASDGSVTTLTYAGDSIDKISVQGNGATREYDLTVAGQTLSSVSEPDSLGQRVFGYAGSFLSSDTWNDGTSNLIQKREYTVGGTAPHRYVDDVKLGSSILAYDVNPLIAAPGFTSGFLEGTVKQNVSDLEKWQNGAGVSSAGESKRKYQFNALGQLSKLETSFEGNKINETTWFYDNLGSVVSQSVKMPDGTFRHSFYRYDYTRAPDTNQDAQTPDTYTPEDYRGNVTRVISSSGYTINEYETRDSHLVGALVKTTQHGKVYASGLPGTGGPEHAVITTYDRKENGLLEKLEIQRADADNYVETWAFGVNGLLESHVDANGLKTKYTEYNTQRQPTNVTVLDDQINKAFVTVTTFDGLGFVDTESLSHATVGAEEAIENVTLISTTETDFRTDGVPLRTEVKAADNSVLSRGEMTYDVLGQLKTETYLQNVDTNVSVTNEYEYNAAGQLLSQTLASNSDYYPNHFTQGTESQRQKTTFTYYKDGSLKNVKDAINGDDLISEHFYEYAVAGFDLDDQSITVNRSWDVTHGIAGPANGLQPADDYESVLKTETDILGRTVRIWDPNIGTFAGYKYDDPRLDLPTTVRKAATSGDLAPPPKDGEDPRPDYVDTIIGYDAYGRVLYEKTGSAAGTVNAYDELGYLTASAVYANRGAEFAFETSPTGQVTKQTETRKSDVGKPLKIVNTYKYDKFGRSTESKDALIDTDGLEPAKTEYGFEGDVLVTTYTDRYGRTEKTWTDPIGRVFQSENARGGQSHFEYDAAGNLLKQTVDGDGAGAPAVVQEFAYDAHGRMRSQEIDGIKTYYDFFDTDETSNGWTQVVTDESGAESFTKHDSQGRVILQVGPEGTGGASPNQYRYVINSYEWQPSSQQLAVVTYDTIGGSPVSTITPHNDYDYLLVSRQTRFVTGSLLKQEQLNGGQETPDIPNDDVWVEHQSATYDDVGRPHSQTVQGVKTFFHYDDLESGTGQAYAAIHESVTDPDDATYKFFDSAGNLVRVKSDDSNVRWAYDEFGRPISESIFPDETVDNAGPSLQRTWEYNGTTTISKNRNGWTIESIFDPGSSQVTETVKKPDGTVYQTSTIENYSNGQLKSAENKNATGGTISRYELEYDNRGRQLKQTASYQNVPQDNVFTYSYGDFDSASGTYTTTRTLQNAALAADLTTTYVLDNLNRPTSVKNTSSIIGDTELKYIYSTGFIDKTQHFDLTESTTVPVFFTDYAVDSNRKVSSIRHYQGPDESSDLLYGQSIYYDDYNAVYSVGNESADSVGEQIKVYGRDDRRRINEVSDHEDPAQATEISSYSFDHLGNPLGTERKYGQILEDKNNRYGYDKEGNVTEHWRLETKIDLKLNHGNQQYPDSTIWEDLKATSSLTELLVGWYRLRLGALNLSTSSGLSEATLKIDLIDQSNESVFEDSPNSSSANASYTVKLVESSPGEYLVPQQKTLDVYVPSNGNYKIKLTIETSSHMTVKGDYALDRFDEANRYEYDHMNRLIKATFGGIDHLDTTQTAPPSNGQHHYEYVYDVLGNRISKVLKNQSNGIEEASFYVIENGKPIYEFDENENLESFRAYDAAGKLSYVFDRDFAIDGSVSDEERIFLAHDHQGTAAALYVSTSNFEIIDYGDFGALPDSWEVNGSESSLHAAVGVGYLGMEFDAGVELYTQGGRYQNPTANRWLTASSLANGAGSIYAFGHNRPADWSSDQNLTQYVGKTESFGSIFWDEYFKEADAVGQWQRGNYVRSVVYGTGQVMAAVGVIGLGIVAAPTIAASASTITASGAALYAAKTTATALIGTAAEYGMARAMGDDSFNPLTAFGRNFAVDAVMGVIPGAAEAKNGAKLSSMVARYGAHFGKQVAVATTVETAYSVGVEGKDFGSAFTQAVVGNVVGQGVGDVLSAGLRRALPKIVNNSPFRFCFVADTRVVREITSERRWALTQAEASSTYSNVWFAFGTLAVGAAVMLLAPVPKTAPNREQELRQWLADRDWHRRKSKTPDSPDSFFDEALQLLFEEDETEILGFAG